MEGPPEPIELVAQFPKQTGEIHYAPVAFVANDVHSRDQHGLGNE